MTADTVLAARYARRAGPSDSARAGIDDRDRATRSPPDAPARRRRPR